MQLRCWCPLECRPTLWRCTRHWRHLVSTTEPSVCGGDAALRHITCDRLFEKESVNGAGMHRSRRSLSAVSGHGRQKRARGSQLNIHTVYDICCEHEGCNVLIILYYISGRHCWTATWRHNPTRATYRHTVGYLYIEATAVITASRVFSADVWWQKVNFYLNHFL